MVGDCLPSLSLPVLHSKASVLSDLNAFFSSRRAILIGHPGAFTHYSTSQMFPEYIAFSKENKIEVFAFSVNDEYVLRAYMSKCNITIPMISDFAGELTRHFNLELPAEEFFSHCCRRTVILLENSVILGVSSELSVQYTEKTAPATISELFSSLA